MTTSIHPNFKSSYANKSFFCNKLFVCEYRAIWTHAKIQWADIILTSLIQYSFHQPIPQPYVIPILISSSHRKLFNSTLLGQIV